MAEEKKGKLRSVNGLNNKFLGRKFRILVIRGKHPTGYSSNLTRSSLESSASLKIFINSPLPKILLT